MKHLALLAAIAVFGAATPAFAKPVKLNKAQLDKVVAGQQQNFAPGQFPGGNPAQSGGNSNTVPPR